MAKVSRKLLSVGISAIIFFTSFSSILVSAEPINEEIKEIQSEYGELGREVDGLNDKIQLLDEEISPLIAELEKNNEEINKINSDIENNKQNIQKLKEDISKKQDIMDDRVRELYKTGGQTSYLLMILDSKNFNDLLFRLDLAIRLVYLDGNAVQDILDKKDILDNEIFSLEEKEKELIELNEDIEEKKIDLEEKKANQQELVDKAKNKQAEFNKQFLIPKEREMVKPQIDVCLDEGGSVDDIRSSIKQLKALKEANQIISEEVIKEINNAINKGEQIIRKKQGLGGNGVTVTGSASMVLNEAYKHLGKAYVWGAKGPDVFDCSGFTSYVYRHSMGVEIGPSTYQQIYAGREVSYSQLQPGDLVFPDPGHVGIYVGNGQMIHAPHTGDVVKVGKVYRFWRARRILD